MLKNNKVMPRRLPSKRAAEFIGVPVTFLERDRYEAGQTGTPPKIPFLRLGHRTILYDVDDLEGYLASCRVD
jgi:hypothetical protein